MRHDRWRAMGVQASEAGKAQDQTQRREEEMTPAQIKAIQKTLGDADVVCAFQLHAGPILTGTWEVMRPDLVVITLSDRDAPPIYVAMISIEAIAVSNVNGNRAVSVQELPVPLAAKPKRTRTTSSSSGGDNG